MGSLDLDKTGNQDAEETDVVSLCGVDYHLKQAKDLTLRDLEELEDIITYLPNLEEPSKKISDITQPLERLWQIFLICPYQPALDWGGMTLPQLTALVDFLVGSFKR